MRRLLVCLVILLVVASAATTGVRASTDCERWFTAYKNSLAQTKPVKNLRVANHRLRRYVHRKLAAMNRPKPAGKPKVLHAHVHRPKMNREEMLRHFNLACGELPEETPGTQMLQAEDKGPDLFTGDLLPSEVPLMGVPGDSGLIASNVLPPYFPGEGGSPGTSLGGIPGGGGFGGGGITPREPTKGSSNPDAPGTPGVPVQPVIPAVPEPSSVVLLLTGIAGAAGMVRRRM